MNYSDRNVSLAILLKTKEKGHVRHPFFHLLMIVLFRLFLKNAFIRRSEYSIKPSSFEGFE